MQLDVKHVGDPVVEHQQRRQAAWDQQLRLHPPASAAREELMERLEDRAHRLSLLSGDLHERARATRSELATFRARLEAQERNTLPGTYVVDPGDHQRLAELERQADRLGREAAAMSSRARAARTVADACTRYLKPQQQGGLTISKFTLGRGAR